MKSILRSNILLIQATCAIILLNVSLFAQMPDTLWTKTFGGSDYDAGLSVLETSDGSYIVAGVTTSQINGDQNIWIIKTNNYGDTLWTKIFGGKFNDDCFSMLETTDNGYLICGNMYSSQSDNCNIWLIKTDKNGNTIWNKIIEGSGINRAYAIRKLIDDNYVITGYTSSVAAGNVDILLLKIDIDGNIVWQRTYGGSGDDKAFSLVHTKDGEFVIVGSTDSYGAGRLDMYIVKTNANGDTIWSKVYGTDGFDYGRSIQETSDGGFIVAGYTTPLGNTWGDVWILKINSIGNIQWSKTFGGNYYDFSSCIKEIENKEYLILASTESFGTGASDLWILKIDEQGNTIWDKTYGGFSFEYGSSLEITKDHKILITGKTASYGAGYYDVWLIKIASEPDSPSQIETKNSFNNYFLTKNYPNPFNSRTKIEFSLPKTDFVTLKIYNSLGKEISSLTNQKLSPGQYKYEWDAIGFASGIYYYKIKAGKYEDSKKLLLLK